MFSWNNLKFSTKIALLGVGIVLLTGIALLTVVAWQSSQYDAVAESKVDEVTQVNLANITRGIYNMVTAQGESVQQQVNYNLNVARNVLSHMGRASLAQETIAWTAINQFTQEPVEVRLPKMLIGGNWLGQTNDFAVETPVVDEVVRLVGSTATIFQRMNATGDMLRVATTVPTTEGKRAIGTYIPAVMPDGTPNPVVATVLKGQAYRGTAFVVNAWYVTTYEPIWSNMGDLIGMLYVGIQQENIKSLRQVILDTNVGITGDIYVLGGKSDRRGRYIISPDGLRDGEDIWETRGANGEFVFQSIVNKAVSLKPGEVEVDHYLWQKPGTPAPREKVIQAAYYEPWDWVIVSEVYKDELEEYQSALETGRLRMIGLSSAIGLGIVLAIGLIGYLIARSVIRPLTHLTSTASQIAAGNLTLVAQVKQQDEIGALAQAFNTMTAKLRGLIENLEERVAERTADLERRSGYLATAAEVGRTVASILDADQLIQQVVKLIQERFGLYYVGLFLVDETAEWAVLRAGTGEAGRIMLARGHRIKVGEGMSGWSIANAQARFAQEADKDSVRLATPELPDTRSEAALPLRSRGRVIGAITVQSSQTDTFDRDTLAILQTVVDQIAIALDNARLFAETQSALEAERRAYGEISREAWSQMIQAEAIGGYRCDQTGVAPASGDWLPEMKQAARNKRVILASHEAASMAAVPIQVRENVLGTLNFRKAGENKTWTQEEVTLLETLADQLGVALESARLYQDTQRRAARERMLREVTARVRSSTDPETVLKSLLREVGTVLGRQTFIRLVTSEENLVPQATGGNGNQPGGREQPTSEGGK